MQGFPSLFQRTGLRSFHSTVSLQHHHFWNSQHNDRFRPSASLFAQPFIDFSWTKSFAGSALPQEKGSLQKSFFVCLVTHQKRPKPLQYSLLFRHVQKGFHTQAQSHQAYAKQPLSLASPASHNTIQSPAIIKAPHQISYRPVQAQTHRRCQALSTQVG